MNKGWLETWIMGLLWVSVGLLTITRPFLPVHVDVSAFSLYKDASHLFTGGLIGAAIGKKSWSLFWMAAIPSGMELVVAIIGSVL